MITPSELRQNLYKILKITAKPSKSKLDNLKKRDVLNCAPDEIIHINWDEGALFHKSI